MKTSETIYFHDPHSWVVECWLFTLSSLIIMFTHLCYMMQYLMDLEYKNLMWGSVVDGLFQPKGWPLRLCQGSAQHGYPKGWKHPSTREPPYWILFLAQHHRKIEMHLFFSCVFPKLWPKFFLLISVLLLSYMRQEDCIAGCRPLIMYLTLRKSTSTFIQKKRPKFNQKKKVYDASFFFFVFFYQS